MLSQAPAFAPSAPFSVQQLLVVQCIDRWLPDGAGWLLTALAVQSCTTAAGEHAATVTHCLYLYLCHCHCVSASLPSPLSLTVSIPATTTVTSCPCLWHCWQIVHHHYHSLPPSLRLLLSLTFSTAVTVTQGIYLCRWHCQCHYLCPSTVTNAGPETVCGSTGTTLTG